MLIFNSLRNNINSKASKCMFIIYMVRKLVYSINSEPHKIKLKARKKICYGFCTIKISGLIDK